jgi:outer membrane protein W
LFSQGQGGGITLELDADLFTVDELSIMPSFVKARYFITDEIAVRAVTWFDYTSDQWVPEITVKHSYFAARPGFEYHLASSPGEFSSYVGLEMILDQAKHKFDFPTGGVVIDGTSETIRNNIRNFENRGFFSWGPVLVAGADIYMGSNFYVGTEVGLAYTFTNHAEVKWGNDIFLEKAKSQSFRIDLTRLVRIGILINL